MNEENKNGAIYAHIGPGFGCGGGEVQTDSTSMTVQDGAGRVTTGVPTLRGDDGVTAAAEAPVARLEFTEPQLRYLLQGYSAAALDTVDDLLGVAAPTVRDCAEAENRLGVLINLLRAYRGLKELTP